MKTKSAFSKALKEIRHARGLTQEDFSDISSRTYISILERGLKSPTLDKVDDLSSVMKVHPMTLLALTYLRTGKTREIDDLCKIIRSEISKITND